MKTLTFREWDKSTFLLFRKVKTQIILVRRNTYAAVASTLPAAISKQEAARGERFFQNKDKEVYLLGKYALRKILAEMTGLPPSELPFSMIGNGKPFFEEQEFNLTHSDDHTYLAFSPFAIGIDAEKINPDFDTQSIIDACFSDEERALLSDGNYLINFYTVWTRKEALLKATGEGLCEDMKQVAILEDQVTRYGKKYFLATRRHEDYIISYASLHADTDEQCRVWSF
jgi:4'-phosphopantetheinyl transferase